VPEWQPSFVAPTVYCDHVKNGADEFIGVTATSIPELEEEKKIVQEPNYV